MGMETEHVGPLLLADKEDEELGGLGGGLGPRRRPESLPLVGAGLVNLGNTCFLNAVLQCVTHTVPLLQSLRSLPHPYPCFRRRGDGTLGNSGFCSLCSLKQHIDLCTRERDKLVEPSGFVNNLSDISSSFGRYQQEDAHEFLNCLLDNLDNRCLNPNFGVNDPMKKDSIIQKIFGGRLRSQVQCRECGHRSDTYEPLLDLSLEIEDADSLEDALESFTKVEKIEDPEIKFTCEGCKARVSVQKQLTLHQSPLVIALHLKRFKSQGYYVDKIDRFVKYPVNLDVKLFHSHPEDVGDLKYELYAAVMHQGASPLYGHYYCFVRPSPDLWYMMDDDKVYQVSEENALNQSAYILFYVKQGTPWFSSLLEQERHLDASDTSSPVSVVDHVETCQTSSSESEDDNRDASLQTPKADDNDAPPDADKNVGESDDVLNLPEASECTEPGGVGNDSLPPSPPDDDRLVIDRNEVGPNTVACLPSSRAGCVFQTEEKPRVVQDASCLPTATLHSRSCPSTNPDVNGAETGHATPSGVSECRTPQNEDASINGAESDHKTITPCTPKRLSLDKFYDETWEEEKETQPKLVCNSAPAKPATKASTRERAALDSYMRTMPKSRRAGLEELMNPGRRVTNSDHQKKRKLHLDSENSPCRSSSTMLSSGNLLPSSVLRQLVSQDDSQLILAVETQQRGKRK